MTGREIWRAYRRWWLDFEVSAVKLAVFRVAFFAVLGLDAWLWVSHAPRYGVEGFNVSQFSALDPWLPTPQRELMIVLFLLQGYLALRLVFGAASRIAVCALTALFGVSYFISQLDSYQHHYLVFLLLLCCCFVPFEARERTRSWAVRLILIQISLLYLWAAIAKLEPHWLDGEALGRQIHVLAANHKHQAVWVRDLVYAVFDEPVASGDFAPWAPVAKLILVTELFLAIALHVPILRLAALIIGPLFHLGVELAGFDIGLFSYFMLGLYVLLLPDAWLERLAALARERLGSALGAGRRLLEGPVGRFAPFVALAAGAALLLAVPFPQAKWVAALALAVGAAEVWRRRPAGLAHLAGGAALIAVTLYHPDPARDHYRYLGGSLRRRGKLEEATRVYEKVVAGWPDYAGGHTSLGKLYRKTGRYEEAIEEYRRAQELAPLYFVGYYGEAITLVRAGEPPEEVARAAEEASWRAMAAGELGRAWSMEKLRRRSQR